MAKSELKTKETSNSVEKFIKSVKDELQQADSFELIKIFTEASGEEPKMWGKALVGFGKTNLVYASGRELEWMKVGFSPRKGYFSIYITGDFKDREKMILALGKLTKTKGCLNVKKLADLNKSKLKDLIKAAVKNLK